MGWGPGTARCHVELARMGLGVGDELGNRPGRDRWIHYQDLGCADDGRDRRNVADEIETKLFVHRSIYRVRRSDQEERVAISGRTHGRLGADVAAAARPVLHDKLLAQSLG